MSSDWGTVTVGRIALRETFVVSETGGDTRKLSVDGQEESPDLTRVQLIARHDNVLALEGTVVPVTFTDKPERNGFYTVESVTAEYTEWRGEALKSAWHMELTRLGTANELDLQSRLTGAARLNSFSLAGETWHAPPIGHYGYFTAGVNPSAVTRTGSDGVMMVYRGVAASESPRWGCDPTLYGAGRVRFLSEGLELTGCDQRASGTDWELSNGLIRVTPSGAGTGNLNVSVYASGGWQAKGWRVFYDTINAALSDGWDSVTLVHNEFELVTVRFTKSLSPGRFVMDMTLRRGARFVEGYLKRGTADTLTVRRDPGENFTNAASAGYIVATSNDAAGNRYVAGSALNFTTHASGGVVKAATTSLDFFLGSVVNGTSPASGDEATALRNQYIGALPEMVKGVRR